MHVHWARRSFSVVLATSLVAGACGGGAGGGAGGAAQQPTKPVEFVISTAPGGGSDIYARVMQGIIEKRSTQLGTGAHITREQVHQVRIALFAHGRQCRIELLRGAALDVVQDCQSR